MNQTPSQPITPLNNLANILSIVAVTENEVLLMAALQEAQGTIENLQCQVVELQALSILNNMYCNKLCFQLAHREEKKAKDGEKGRLIGDGLPKMLTGDEFYKQVVEFIKWQKENEVAKETKKQVGLEYKEHLAAWNKAEEDHKTKNKEIMATYHKAVAAWEKQKAKTRAAGKLQQFKEAKPKRRPLLKANPKPEHHEVNENKGSDGEEFDEAAESDSDDKGDNSNDNKTDN